MTAKEYLQQIQQLNLKIEQKKLQLKESRDLIENISTVRTDSIRVQKSGYSDKIGDMVAKIVDLEAEIDNELIGLFELKHYIIGQLHRLKNNNHVELWNCKIALNSWLNCSKMMISFLKVGFVIMILKKLFIFLMLIQQ